MHESDKVLKLLFQGSAQRALRELTGLAVSKWLNVELPSIRTPRADLIGETSDGGLLHLKLQSRNETGMEVRMAEYYLAVWRLFNEYPQQVLLYFGPAKMRMNDRLRTPSMSFHYRLIDIRELDGEKLLQSPEVGDNIVAILTRLRNRATAIRQIIGRIADLSPPARSAALHQLLLICGLRGLEEKVVREVKRVPVFDDILDNKVLGPPFKRGLRQGEEQGLEKGRIQGELSLVRRMLRKRFGPLPAWVTERLRKSSHDEIEAVALRLLDAKSLRALFPK